MLSNPRDLRIPTFLTMSTSLIRHSMVSNKHLVLGMSTLRELLLDRGFQVGQIDPTLFTKRVKGELFICQLYVDDIIFGSTNKAFNDEFSKLMTDRFEMSMMGELKFFLGFEIKQLREGTFIYQAKYTQDMLKKFKMNDAKGKRFPMDTKCHLELRSQW